MDVPLDMVAFIDEAILHMGSVFMDEVGQFDFSRRCVEIEVLVNQSDGLEAQPACGQCFLYDRKPLLVGLQLHEVAHDLQVVLHPVVQFLQVGVFGFECIIEAVCALGNHGFEQEVPRLERFQAQGDEAPEDEQGGEYGECNAQRILVPRCFYGHRDGALNLTPRLAPPARLHLQVGSSRRHSREVDRTAFHADPIRRLILFMPGAVSEFAGQPGVIQQGQPE